MPIFSTLGSGVGQIPKTPKDVVFSWDTFRKGLNLFSEENEVQSDELVRADNIILKGKGIPTKRWGTALYFQAGNATGMVRGLKGVYYSSGTVELLSITDDGFLTRRNEASYTRVNGASFASGNSAYMAQLEDKIYIVNGQRELVRYSMPTLVGFPTIAVPTLTGATNISNATGSTVKGYRVSAISQVGETLASSTFELRNQPATLGTAAGGVVRLFITPPSTVSGVLQGMNIYGRDPGYERFLGYLPGNATIFEDNGSAIPREFAFSPTADSTGGPNAKYIKRFQDRLVFAGLRGEPSKVLISGKAPNQEKFDLASGGNFIEIEPDAGDDITQVEIFRDRIIVFKEKSIWQVTLTFEQIGNFFVTTPNVQLITSSHGCIAPRSVVVVEGDIYFLSRRGVNSLGYEAGFTFDVLRSSELSIKVRPFFQNLTTTQKEQAVAIYKDFKYIIAFPGLDKSMVLDRERMAWLGPWSQDASVFEIFFDANNNEHLLFGSDTTTNVYEYSDTFTNDSGSDISTILKTRQEDFGGWSSFKTIKEVFYIFKSLNGTVNMATKMERRNGTSFTEDSTISISSDTSSGWGADMWGTAMWGATNFFSSSVDTAQFIKWVKIDKTSRNIQMILSTTGVSDNYELLGIRGVAQPIEDGVRPSIWRLQ